MIVVPHGITDDSLRCLSRCYKNQRIPIPTWRHDQNGAILLRGSLSHAKGVIGMFKAHPTGSTNPTDSTGFQEQDRYFNRIIEITPHNTRFPRELFESNLSMNSVMSADDLLQANHLSVKPQTPDSNRRLSGAFNTVRSLSSFKNSTTSVSKAINKWGSLKSGSLSSTFASSQPLRDIDEKDSPQSYIHRVPLYILGEKSQSKSARLTELNTEFIPVDYADVRQSRLSFKKLMRACLPSTESNDPEQTFAKLLEQSDWLQQTRNLLQLSGAVVDLIDIQGSNVTLSLEDGWDATAQVSSLAQLCLDPYYRTIEGFRVLIEKEWLAFGHRFAHRSILKSHSSSGTQFAPVFLQFLDAVHQIHLQFPLSFEFNDFYLRFLAYHSVSCRFRTFLFDCELERFDSGIATIEDKRGSLNSKHVVETGTGSDDDIFPGGIRSSGAGATKIGYSVFDYIDRQHAKSPVFFNFMYINDKENFVLRPQSSFAMLDLWSFYTDEELAHGPPYDLELVCNDSHDDDDVEYLGSAQRFGPGANHIGGSSMGGSMKHQQQTRRRRVVTVGYDSLMKSDSDAFTRLLDELRQVESERGLLPQKWRQVWDHLVLPQSDTLTRNTSFSSALVRSHGRLLHKRSTMEILMRGRLSGNHHQQETFVNPHRFEKHLYTTPAHCNYCDGVLWNPMWTGLK